MSSVTPLYLNYTRCPRLISNREFCCFYKRCGEKYEFDLMNENVEISFSTHIHRLRYVCIFSSRYVIDKYLTFSTSLATYFFIVQMATWRRNVFIIIINLLYSRSKRFCRTPLLLYSFVVYNHNDLGYPRIGKYVGWPMKIFYKSPYDSSRAVYKLYRQIRSNN